MIILQAANTSLPNNTLIGFTLIISMLALIALVMVIKKLFKITEHHAKANPGLEYKNQCNICWRKLETAKEARKGLCNDCQMDLYI